MRFPVRLAAVGLLAFGMIGCAKGSAESAIAAAEKAVAGVRDEAAKVSPVELKALDDTIASLKAKVAAGDYQPALMGARSVSTMARDLGANVATRKTQLSASFNAMVAELPKQVEAVTAKVAELSALKKLPAGINAGQLEALKTEVASWGGAWKAATDAFAAGNLADALAKGNEVKAKVGQAMALLGRMG